MDWGYLIGLLGTAAGGVAAVYGLTRTRRRDARDDGRSDGVILTELGYIKSGVEDIKTEQREQRKINTELYARLSGVEASAKQAHKRIDGIEGREERL